MKFSIDDLLKNPILIMIVLIVGTSMTIFVSQNYASVDFLEKRIREAKESSDKDSVKINAQLIEIRSSLKDMDRNILEIYKTVKYQEGRNAR